ncbi:autotransporter outer membrane beta-barrel domain-containing protein [uncultured Dialister sp.]|uniref:autotransporter outer membrane beta-barrel domain-containing protein n=1 Tax=uncultured Dialister sp. TaxID=278064 RepID=UPI0026DA90C8|nr:autotransporter outer membrane beta-barrel domain-containing protein [uncultured Dialister sp.]
MVHLTNDYRKLLRRNGPKAALSLCVALALSGGLVSAEGKTYEYVNQWGVREALEGDPIEVKWMGSGDVTLQAGTDETGEVIVHSLATSGNPDVYVKGKKITIGDNYPSSDPTKTEPVRTANWGGTISIGGDTTESVNMEGFCTSGQNSDTNIRGGSISLGSLDNWGGTVTINTDGDFKVAKDNVAADVNVTGNRVETNQGKIYYGGTLSITAGSMDARKLSVAGQSKADIHITGANGLHLKEGISATEDWASNYKGGTTQIDSPVITIDASSVYNGITESNHSTINLQGKDLFVKSGLGITDSSLNASETGTIQLGKKDADFRFTASHISLGSETSSTNIYGNIITYGYQNNSSLAIHGKDILIAGVGDGEIGVLEDTISTNGDIVTIGDESSNVELKGRLSNSGSSVTVNGQKIHISSPHAVNAGSAMQEALRTMGNANATTAIGSEKTDSVIIDGLTWVDNGSLSMYGKNIQLSRSQGIALSGSQDAKILIGGNETGNVTISGQVVNRSANVMKLSGKHITIDSTQYDGSEEGFFSQSLVTGANGIDAGDENTKTISISGGLRAGAGDINVKGRNITIGASHYFNTHKIRVDPQDGFIANAAGGKVNIGSDESEMVHLYDGQLLAGGADINILGKNISVASSTDYITPDKDGSVNMIHAKGGNVSIGSENSDTVALSGGKLFADDKDITVKGKNISVASSSDYITPDKDGSVTMVHAAGGNVNIGSENSDSVALSGGRLLADGKDITIQGHHISLDGKQQWAGRINDGKLTIGSPNTDSVSIQGEGGIHALGGKTDIKGKRISIHSDVQNALENAGAPIHVGDSGTQSVDISGGIVSHGSNISIMGRDISISKGKQENAIHAKGGTVSIHASSDEETRISGPVVNDYGVIDFSFSGKSSYLKSNQVIDNTPGTVRADKYGYLYDRNGKMLEDANGNVLNIHSIKDIPDEAIEGIWLSLHNQASWEPSKDSSFYSYNGDEGHIRLDNEAHQTITVSKFKDADTRIHEDIYGSGNTGNDTIHIDNTYTGHTHFWLVNREGTDKGVVGTILASAGTKESPKAGTNSVMVMAALNSAKNNDSSDISQFTADHFAAYGMNSLFFKTYDLGIQDSNVEKNNEISDTTKGNLNFYDKDLYITGVTNHTTNEHGQYTPTVSTALSGSSLMYYTWRTENDKMLQRVGDLRENEGEETGLWARIRGSRIGKSHSDRGFKNQYKVYEIGYDAKTEDNDRMKSFTGIAFSYLDGKGYYTDGRGTNQATSAAIYHTDIHKTGHYLDLVFRIRHMNERFHTHTTVDADIGPITEDHSASMDTTGLSFSAEYGRKKFVGNGWYVEPQTQWTLGYLGPNQYEMDNGTRVEQPGITSFVGRVGFNLGRQVNPNSIVYLKANVYHEFGGHSPIHLYAGDESLSFTDTFDDTWFEYGVGFAMKLGSRFSLYGDFEKSAGSHFYKDWQWNAGIRYSF